MLKIGLTGGIGSGKSAAAEMFSQLGVCVIDADEISHSLTQAGSPITQQIAEHFGEIVLKEKALDRRALGKIIFQDESSRKWLEDLLHPAIIQSMLARAKEAASPYCILVIPLLIEGHFQHIVDRVLVIDTPVEMQIKRAMQRDQKTEAEIRAILQAQSSRETKLAHADDSILNDGSLETLEKAVNALHIKYLNLAKDPTIQSRDDNF